MKESNKVLSWQRVWQQGIAPSLSNTGLSALQHALTVDDPQLIQGATTTPPPLQCVQDWPCEAACLIGYAGWRGEGLETVGQVEAYFAHVCFQTDLRLDEPAACRWFLNFFDDAPRDKMRAALLVEVAAELQRREALREIPCSVAKG